MGELVDRLCEAVRRWDERSGTTESEETGAWYVLGYLLERPEWRALVEAELEEPPTVASMQRCLLALSARGALPERELVPQLIRAVEEQLESLSEDHAKVVRRRRRWLAAVTRQPDRDRVAEQRTQAMLSRQAVWEEMRRYRVYLMVWREVTAALI